MTEANMKKLYEWFLSSGQTKRAEGILKIKRYAKFKKTDSKEESKEVK